MCSQAEPNWGVKINRRGYDNPAIPETAFPWAIPMDKDDYQRSGVVVWSHQAQRLEVLSAARALQLLEHMRNHDSWKTDGMPILRQSTRLLISDTPKKKGRDKKDQIVPEVKAQESKPETVVEERFRLEPEQSVAFLQTLEANESHLREMAAEDEAARERIMAQVYGLLFKHWRAREGDDIDFSTRPFSWEKIDAPLTWVCNRPPNRGSISLTESHFFWTGCIEQPDRFQQLSPTFVKLEEALSWVEQELEEIEQEAKEPVEPDRWQPVPLAELMAQKREALADYWIEPAALEPERLSYQVLINLDYAPYDYKTIEISFGKKYYYDEKFASPTQLARDLHLDPQLDIQELTDGWYRLVSRVSYYLPEVVLAQAQRFWDQSAIVQQHRAGKVLRAQYGYREVETGYDVIIGACEDPDRPYPLQKSREAYLTLQAFKETLNYALDVASFRALSGLGPETMTDEWILEMMHRRRAKSPYVPLEAQLESERWLRLNQQQT